MTGASEVALAARDNIGEGEEILTGVPTGMAVVAVGDRSFSAGVPGCTAGTQAASIIIITWLVINRPGKVDANLISVEFYI